MFAKAPSRLFKMRIDYLIAGAFFGELAGHISLFNGWSKHTTNR